MSRVVIKKLDRRFTGSRHFKYLAKPITFQSGYLAGLYQTRTARYDNFNELRTWCWETWGASAEYSIWLYLPDDKKNLHWAWDTENTKLRLYLASDKEAAWMRLKWE